MGYLIFYVIVIPIFLWLVFICAWSVVIILEQHQSDGQAVKAYALIIEDFIEEHHTPFVFQWNVNYTPEVRGLWVKAARFVVIHDREEQLCYDYVDAHKGQQLDVVWCGRVSRLLKRRVNPANLNVGCQDLDSND